MNLAWMYAHMGQVGVALLAANTVFQKLPIQEQNDLIAVAWKGCKWTARSIVATLSQSQKKELQQTVDELKKRVAELECQPVNASQPTAPAGPTLVQGK